MGEVVFVGAGRIVPKSAFEELPAGLHHAFSSFAPGLIAGPANHDELSGFYSLPTLEDGNLSRRQRVFVAATRNIKPGEALSIRPDYIEAVNSDDWLNNLSQVNKI
jgi:hypothetical protein